MKDSKSRVAELLGRSEQSVLSEASRSLYNNKTVLVTGGGGSIGSELVRILATLHPRKIIIFDIYENNAYDLSMELIHQYGSSLDFTVEIGSVRDRDRLDDLFSRYKPEIIFHAAAHKHVPLMEYNPEEAVKNNVLGTYNTADMAEKYGAEKFVLISTDKAVNPTSIMGATKRICEHIVSCRTDGKTAFCSVRFGNVLGSAGSVVPLFMRQISAGGPITLTDKRIVRYFMSIREAAELLLETGAMAKRGEIFVLDMGEPIRIFDLAKEMIEKYALSGEKIEIREIGLRPGEKLYEELLVNPEKHCKTSLSKIFIEREEPKSRAEMEAIIYILKDFIEKNDKTSNFANLKSLIQTIVPEYTT
jgi:FlaA1/EpsC-like NDP-sugar epimerase